MLSEWDGMYCKTCGQIGLDWCECERAKLGDNAEPERPHLTLTIPRDLTVEDAKYWLTRARQLCPDREIVPTFK